MAEGGKEANTEDRCMRDGSNTVEVQCFSKSMSLEDLETYFKNSRQSGGGDIEEVRIRDGVIYITFKEAEVAQRVISHGNHQIAGRMVTLFHHSPPKHCYENKIFVQGLNSAITEELLRNFLETATEAKVREFLYGEEERNAVVTLSDNIDIHQLRNTFQERNIEGAFLKVARVAISNCILVQNIQKSTSKDAVLLYFVNKRSYGGDVESVEMMEGYCLVYFQDCSVIDRVLSKSHKVDGADVEVHLHHECLGRRSSRNKSDPFLRISSPGNKKLKISRGYEEKEACISETMAVEMVQSTKLLNEDNNPTGSKSLVDIKGKLIPAIDKSFQGESQIRQGINLEKSCKRVKHIKHDKQERSKRGFRASTIGLRNGTSSFDLSPREEEKNNCVINQLPNIGQQNLSLGTSDGKSDDKQSTSESSSLDNTRKPFTTPEGIKIFVYRCSILRAPVNVIVNAANEGLRHNAGVARIIADAAGREFLEESNKYIKENGLLDVGTSCITSGGNLKYQYVIHTVGPQWDKYSKTSQGLQKCMNDLWKAVIGCFFKAETLQVQSIALPAVSSGWHGVPMEICAVQYFSAVMGYSSSAQGSCSLKEIHFIDMDYNILELTALVFTAKLEDNSAADKQFNKRLQRVWPRSVPLSIQQTAMLDASLKKTGHTHNVSERNKTTFQFTEFFRVLIYNGDITNNKCKAMVTCETRGLKSQVGDVLEIDAGKMKSKEICCIIPKWTSSMSDEEYKRHLGQCFRNILEKARTYESVVMPLIGKGFKDKISGRILLDCLLRFSDYHREKEPIREVHIVSLFDGPIACVTNIFAEHFDPEKKRLDSLRTNPGCRRIGSTTSYGGQGQSSHNYSLQSMSGEHNKTRVRANMSGTETMTSYTAGPKQSTEAQKMVDGQAECVICMDTCKNPFEMKECGDVFCKGYIDAQFQYKPVCPTCDMIYGVITRNQPKGQMAKKVDTNHDLEGYKGSGMIEITYDMPNGVQGDAHPKPGQRYFGLKTKAYLPNNETGQKVFNLLHLAFKRRLIFTIGLSVTSEKDYVVTWNGIHHKTSKSGGPQKCGYPDPTYLNRVLQELAAIGVTENLKYQDQGAVSAHEIAKDSTL